jgi:manganese-transporting P-type ATPase
VGVALLDGDPEKKDEILAADRAMRRKQQQEALQKLTQTLAQKDAGRNVSQQATQGQAAAQNDGGSNHFAAAMLQAADEDGTAGQLVRFGAAIEASPFTSKLGTPAAVLAVLRHGRCTLATTIQMYKILALNSLVSAFSLSVLALAGVKHSDTQMTLSGILLAGCFLSLSKAKPIEALSTKRPYISLFHPALITSLSTPFYNSPLLLTPLIH